jgi:hypothetical protein
MGYDLHGRGGYFSCNGSAWYHCLNIARAVGWEPAGTIYNGPPEVRFFGAEANPDELRKWAQEWDGSYTYNEYQTVADDDAKAFAAALDRAIEAEKAGVLTKEQRDSIDDVPTDPVLAAAAAHFGGVVLDLSGNKAAPSILKELADFARQGSFDIG